jgi:uncharacterized protein (TIGR00369 family)
MNQRNGLFWDVIEGRASGPPAAELLGWELLDIDPDKGTIKLKFQARPEFLNPIGVIQGGFLTAMLDEALGGAIAAMLGPARFAPTVELKVNFIRSAHVGPIVAEARVIHQGISVIFLQGELRTIEGSLIATGSATAQVQTIRRTS